MTSSTFKFSGIPERCRNVSYFSQLDTDVELTEVCEKNDCVDDRNCKSDCNKKENECIQFWVADNEDVNQTNVTIDC